MNRKREFIDEYVKLCEEYGYYVDYEFAYGELRLINMSTDAYFKDCLQEIERSIGDN